MQNFAEMPPDPPEEIFVFMECKLFKPHPYQMIATQLAHVNLAPQKSVPVKINDEVKLLQQSCILLSCGNGQRLSCLQGHFSKISGLVPLFVDFIFADSNQSVKIMKICTKPKFPAIQ